MAKLQSIHATIHGHLVSLAPEAPVIVITGPNEAGKTTTLYSPNLAITASRGDFPLVGKSGARFNVEARFDELHVRREVDRKGKHVLTVDGVNGRIDEAQARIDEVLGEAYRFDLVQFQAMTPAKRLRWLEDQVLESVDRDLVPDLEPYIDRICALLTSDEGDYLIETPIYQAHLVTILEHIREADRAAHSDALRLGKAVQQDEREAADQSLPTGTVNSWRAKVDDLDQQASGLVRELGRIEEAQRSRVNLERRISEVEGVITAGQEVDLDGIVDAKDVAIRLTAESIEEQGKEIARLSAEARDADKAAEEKVKAYGEASKGIASIEATIAALTTAPPFLCESCQSQWSDESAAAKERLDEASAKAKGASTQADAAKRRAVKSARSLAEAERIKSKLSDDLRELRRLKDVELSAARKAVEEAKRAADQLEQLRAEAADIPDDLAAGAIQEQLDGIKAERREAQVNADRLTDASVLLANREQRRIDLDAAKDRRDEARELLAELGSNGLLGRVLAEATGPFVDRVNAILHPVTGSFLWVETEGGLTWGYSRGHGLESSVPLETASESHQMAMAIAVVIAIRSQLGGWRAVFVDGIEVMEATRRTAFVEQLIGACTGGLLDDAWVASVEDGWVPPAGVHHVQLGGVS